MTTTTTTMMMMMIVTNSTQMSVVEPLEPIPERRRGAVIVVPAKAGSVHDVENDARLIRTLLAVVIRLTSLPRIVRRIL